MPILCVSHRGSAIAKIVGRNAARLPNFNDRVTMYVFEEMVDGKKLTEIINTTHENVKYLPGHKLPENVVCIVSVNRNHFKISDYECWRGAAIVFIWYK